MATLAPLNTPSRQPFGVLNDSKLRNLSSIKNRQNAITPNSAPTLKRRAPSPELSDSENVDPNLHDVYGKRKRAAHDEDVSLSKPSRYSVHVVPSSKPYLPAPALTPRLDTMPKPTTTPLSAPAAAGRSPTKGKRMGLMQPRKRFVPPSLGTKSPSLSITAALNGTLGHKKRKHRVMEETKPNSWFFDIFEESEEQQSYKMNEWTMTQSATILDISDDENKLEEKSDKGKENIDPNEVYTAPVTRSTATFREAAVPRISRKDTMLDEPRTPLGDLNPCEFYGEGLDATSVILVHEDSGTKSEEKAPAEQQAAVQPVADFTFESPGTLADGGDAETNDVHNLLAASQPVWDIAQPTPDAKIDGDLLQGDSGPIEIWESESAKDEEELVDTKFEDADAFALQEL